MRTILTAVLLITALSPLNAATLEKLSMDEMIAKSTAIVRGRVSASYAAFHGSVIYTHYSVQVLERWKGAPAAQVDVLTPGGAANGLQQIYSGAPKLAAGNEYVLFLWTGKSGLTHVIGLSQGIFTLTTNAKGDTTAYRAASTEEMLNVSGRPVEDEPVRMSLSELSDRINRGLASAGVK